MSRSSILSLAFVGCLSGCAVAAPQEPAPLEPTAMARPFAPLVGRWRGEGTFSPAPDQPAQRFTATAEVRWILGGHFAQEDLEATVGGATTVQTRTIFGWDGARERFVAVSVANDGRSKLTEVAWTAPHVLVATATDVSGEEPVLLRNVWEFGDERYAYRVERCSGAGAWQGIVAGEFTRVDALPQRAGEVSRGGAPTSAEMARIGLLTGSYAVDGERVDAAGRTLARATGTDTVRAMYGGQVLAARTTLGAEGRSRESWRCVAWDANSQRYDVFSFDDTGAVGATQLRWDGEDALVGETVASDGLEKLLASTLVEVGSDGIRTVRTRTVRATGEVVDQVAIRYRRTEERR